MEFGYKLKTALFGFSKRDVLKCVEELNATHEEALSDLREQVSAAEAAGVAVEEKLGDAREAVLELNRRLEDQQKKSVALETVVKRLVENRTDSENEISQLKERVTADNNRFAELVLKNNELARKLNEANQKVEKYDALTQNISDVMLEARQMSAHLREDAEEKAGRILEGARESAAQVRTDLDLFQRKIGQIGSSLEKLMDSLQDEVGRIEQSFDDLNDGLDRLEDVPERVQPGQPDEKPESTPAEPAKAERKQTAQERPVHKPSGVTDFFGKFREWLQ